MGAALSAMCAPASERLTGHWLGLGRFDHVLITLAKEQETLLQPERTVQSCHHASSHWSCFGRVIRSSFDLESGTWPPDQGVLVGVCGIKLAHGLRDTLQTLDQVAEALAEVTHDHALPDSRIACRVRAWALCRAICSASFSRRKTGAPIRRHKVAEGASPNPRISSRRAHSTRTRRAPLALRPIHAHGDRLCAVAL
jgi:hypothetical protein